MNSPTHDIDISEEDGIRYLHFGSEWIQGAMRIRRPWALELAYTREMMAGLLLHDAPWPRHVLIIGLGAGSLTKFIWRGLPQTKITVVEINPQIPLIARQFFKLPEEDDRLKIRIADGADCIIRDKKHYDLILVDGFDHKARAGALDTLPFYLNCRARLSDRGVLATNLFSGARRFKASSGRIQEAFDERCMVFPACESGNVIAMAVAGQPLAVSLTEMRARAAALKKASGLDLAPTITRLQLAKSLPEETLRL
jgi:spermidine synthase